jgi:hypothetical protein
MPAIVINSGLHRCGDTFERFAACRCSAARRRGGREPELVRRIRIFLSTVAISSVLLPASAQALTFHFWDIAEIYSNCDGTVQFVEFQTTMENQHKLATHSLTSNSNTFIFPTDLPGPPTTANRRFLVATAALAGLGGPVPDYIIPDGFLDASGDTVTLVGADSVTFASLPTDGILSADDVGGTAPNSPRNFADDFASVDGGSCSCVPTGPFEESFDVYPPATSLHGLGDWKGIDNDPFFTAFTTTGAEPANSPPQSADISSNSDLVHEYCAEGVGILGDGGGAADIAAIDLFANGPARSSTMT